MLEKKDRRFCSNVEKQGGLETPKAIAVQRHRKVNFLVAGVAKMVHQQLSLTVELGQLQGSPVFCQQPLPSRPASLTESQTLLLRAPQRKRVTWKLRQVGSCLDDAISA